MAESLGIFIVDVVGRGLMIFSSLLPGFVFFIGTELGIDFVDAALIFVGFICRESTDDDGLEIPVRSLLVVDVSDWLVLGLNGNPDDEDLLVFELADLTGSWEDCFCCWLVLLIGEAFEDETRGFLVTDDDGRGFGSVFTGVDLVSGTFFLSSFVEDGRFVFLIDWAFEAFVDWLLGFAIGIVIVNFDCLESLLDDEIGLVLVEIFLISVLLVVDDDAEEEGWVVFFGVAEEDTAGFLDDGVAVAEEGLPLAFL